MHHQFCCAKYRESRTQRSEKSIVVQLLDRGALPNTRPGRRLEVEPGSSRAAPVVGRGVLRSA